MCSPMKVLLENIHSENQQVANTVESVSSIIVQDIL